MLRVFKQDKEACKGWGALLKGREGPHRCLFSFFFFSFLFILCYDFLRITSIFLSYPLPFDIPCNAMLKKLRPSVWLPLVTLLSGTVTVCMGVVRNADELIIVRMFLGMAQVGSSSLLRVWIVLN